MGLTSAEIICNLRIVLLGKTGSGKSATGNTILRYPAFTTNLSPSSVTKTCQKESGHFDERTVSVIDTPGIFDTSIKDEELKAEIKNCIRLSVPGPHIFLLVIRLDVRFTEEEKSAGKWIKETFGEEASKYTAVLFTRGDELKEISIETFLDQSPALKELISDCKAGYMVFDNKCTHENRTQVAELFEKIDKTVQVNGSHYTSRIYEEAQRQMNRDKLWRQCGETVYSASNYLIGGAAVVAAPAVSGAVMAEEAAAVAVRPLLMLTAAGITKAIGWWMRPKTNS